MLVLLLSTLKVAVGVRVTRSSAQPYFWDQEQKTVSGCECSKKSKCDGRICDTCRTTGWCKGGWVDTCAYGQDDHFEAQTASQKIDYYWSKMLINPKRVVEYPDTLEFLTTFLRSMVTTMDNFRPEMPKGRKKMIHTNGAVCKIKLTLKNSPYTGLLATGTHHGFVRLGLALKPGDNGLVPGSGFKFPRTGVHSGDFVAMNKLGQGQPWNFFANNFSNKLAPESGKAEKALEKKFKEASRCPIQVGLSDLAKYSQDGQAHEPNFPYKLFFVPSSAVQFREEPKDLVAAHEELRSIPKGTKIWDVYACEDQKSTEFETVPPSSLEQSCGSPARLGTVTTTSKCTDTEYGDSHFHIRHQRVAEDWGYKAKYKEGMHGICGLGPDETLDDPETCGYI